MRLYPNVRTGPLGKRMIAFVDRYYSKASQIYVTSGMDGDHGPRPNGSHHYGLKFRGSPTAAIDFGGGGVTPSGSRRMRDFAKWLYDNFAGQTVELIHTTPFDSDHGFYVKGGHKLPDVGFGVATNTAHKNHIHWATSAALMTQIEKRARQLWPPRIVTTKPLPATIPPPKPVPTPAPAPLTFMIDVSHHDWGRLGHNLDWPKIVSQGLGTAVLIRATYGDMNVFAPESPHFVEMAAAARSAGTRTYGGYHNLIKGDAASVARQVDFHRAALDAGQCHFGMADVEAYEELEAKGLVPDWDTVRRFNDRWQAVEPDRVMAWYISRNTWYNIGRPDLRFLVGPLINADYPVSTGARPGDLYARALTAANSAVGDRGWDPYGGRTPDIWQFTSAAIVDGASAKTDCSAFRGTPNALAAMLDDDLTLE